MPLDPLVLVAKVAHIPEPLRIVAIIKTVSGRPQPPGHFTDSRLKCIYCLLVKKVYLLILEPQLEGQAPGFPHIDGLQKLPGNVSSATPCLCTPLASLELNKISQKGANTFIWSPNLSNCQPGHSSRTLSLGAGTVYDCGHTRLYILAYLKSCCLRIWLPISLKLSAENPPLETLTDLGTPLTVGSYQVPTLKM